MQDFNKELMELDMEIVRLLKEKIRLLAGAGQLGDAALVEEHYFSSEQGRMADAAKKALSQELVPRLLRIKEGRTGVVPYPALGLVAEVSRKVEYTYDMKGIVEDCGEERLRPCLAHNIVLLKDLAKTDEMVREALRRRCKAEPGAFSVAVTTQEKHQSRFRRGSQRAAPAERELPPAVPAPAVGRVEQVEIAFA